MIQAQQILVTKFKHYAGKYTVTLHTDVIDGKFHTAEFDVIKTPYGWEAKHQGLLVCQYKTLRDLMAFFRAEKVLLLESCELKKTAI